MPAEISPVYAPSVLPVHVLRGDRDLGAGEELHADGKGHVGRADDDVDAGEILLAEAKAELRGLRRALVHLPVACDQRQGRQILRRCRNHADPGKVLPFEELERRAATGREPRDLVGEPELGQRAS